VLGKLVGQIFPPGFFHFGIFVARPTHNIGVVGRGLAGENLEHCRANMQRLHKSRTIYGAICADVFLTNSPEIGNVIASLSKNRSFKVFRVGQKGHGFDSRLVKIIGLRQKSRQIFGISN